jgi:hypothetical protein
MDLPSHGRGRWFDPSIAHSEKQLFSGLSHYQNQGLQLPPSSCAATVQQRGGAAIGLLLAGVTIGIYMRSLSKVFALSVMCFLCLVADAVVAADLVLSLPYCSPLPLLLASSEPSGTSTGSLLGCEYSPWSTWPLSSTRRRWSPTATRSHP